MSETLSIVWKAVVLGIVEGLTEFVPVSSTGHLIVVSHLLRFGSPEFEIAIQLGAMLALTWCYREQLVRLALDTRSRPAARLFIAKLVLAFLPAALIGLVAHGMIEEYLFHARFVATTLIAGGILIFVIDRPDRRGGLVDLERISFSQAMAVGFGQALALLPGVSRSGATILTGLLAGLERRAATDFSFLLALPTMYAACLYALWKSRHGLQGELGIAMGAGLIAAYVSALLVIHAFLRFVQTNSLRPFGWYRIAIGLVVLIWLSLGVTLG